MTVQMCWWCDWSNLSILSTNCGLKKKLAAKFRSMRSWIGAIMGLIGTSIRGSARGWWWSGTRARYRAFHELRSKCKSPNDLWSRICTSWETESEYRRCLSIHTQVSMNAHRFHVRFVRSNFGRRPETGGVCAYFFDGDANFLMRHMRCWQSIFTIFTVTMHTVACSFPLRSKRDAVFVPIVWWMDTENWMVSLRNVCLTATHVHIATCRRVDCLAGENIPH